MKFSVKEACPNRRKATSHTPIQAEYDDKWTRISDAFASYEYYLQAGIPGFAHVMGKRFPNSFLFQIFAEKNAFYILSIIFCKPC